jgi:hypothetical protein
MENEMRGLNMAVKMVMGLMLATLASAAVAQEGIAPNGQYTSLGVSLFRTKYANEVCLGSECHQGVGGLAFHLSYQALPNLILGLNSASGRSSMSGSEIKESQGGLLVGFVMGVGDYFDIGGVLSPVNKKTEQCQGAVCVNTEESGTNVGLFGKWWMNNEKTFNLGMQLDSYAYKNGSRYSSAALSVAYLLDGHHELSATGERLKDYATGDEVSSSFSLGYQYHF